MSDDRKRIDLVFNEQSEARWHEKYRVELWSDGREYDPDTEAYHTIYSYKITAPNWEFDGNDIKSGANQAPDLNAGMRSLVAFLLACQSGLPEDIEAEAENAELFPSHVREFAYNLKEQLEMHYFLLEKEMENENAGTS